MGRREPYAMESPKPPKTTQQDYSRHARMKISFRYVSLNMGRRETIQNHKRTTQEDYSNHARMTISFQIQKTNRFKLKNLRMNRFKIKKRVFKKSF